MGKVTREAEENATKYFKAMMAINGKMNLTGRAVIKNIDNGSKVINRGNFLFSGTDHIEKQIFDQLESLYPKIGTCKIIVYCYFSPCTECTKLIDVTLDKILKVHPTLSFSFVFLKWYAKDEIGSGHGNLWAKKSEAASAYETLMTKHGVFDRGVSANGIRTHLRLGIRHLFATKGYDPAKTKVAHQPLSGTWPLPADEFTTVPDII